MQLKDVLADRGALRSMASELGISESQAASGAEALLPAVLGGFRKQAQSNGLEGLGGLLGQLGGGSLFDEVLSPRPTDLNRGNDVLGQIFGSRDVSRAVAGNAAAQSGLDAGLLKKMLPMLAMVVAGFMAKQSGAQSQPTGGTPGGGLGDLLGGLLGQSTGAASGGGLGGLASMLDMDGDGNPLDDILEMVSRGTGR